MNRSDALGDASPISFWLDDPSAPPAAPPLVGRTEADLTVVGGGFTGLWAAWLAKVTNPHLDVLLLEADRCGWAASGRNGGFCAASLTHGLRNGIDRFPTEIDTLDRMGMENLDAIETTAGAQAIDCDFQRVGDLTVATEEHQVVELRNAAEDARRHGHPVVYLDTEAVRAAVHSPTYLAGLWDRRGCALVNPARLAWGLRRCCLEVGVRLHEESPVEHLEEHAPKAGTSGSVTLRLSRGEARSDRVALGTNASPSPVRRLRRYIVPVYDYVLMTEPLDPSQLASIGWADRQGVAGCGNRFLYYRLSADDRILFGGYDAVYHFGNGLRPALEQRRATFLKLATLFGETFPQLDDVRFTHAWAGAIDTCSRFCAFFDLSRGRRVASVAGYTGLGVGASRFGAQVMLDLLAGDDTSRTRLQFVTTKPLPFPPEPIRYAGIQLTRWSMASADTHGGRRNLWLRTLDRLGMGFDS